jgi:diguanylate cyclase (GGDEF)-like protein
MMKQILFIDDEPVFLNTIERLLARQRADWQLFFAENVADALDIIHETELDTIVSDITMSGETGFDLLQHLEADRSIKPVPVIMLTGAMDNDLKLKALELGATDLLNKPVSLADLLARINSCLKLKEYQDQILLQNLSLEETVRQQTRHALLAAEISSILVQNKDLKQLLKRCTDALVEYLDVAFARIWVFDEKRRILELMTSSGMYTHINGAHQFVPIGQLKIGRIARDRCPLLTNQVIGDPHISSQEWARQEKMISFAGYPLVVNNDLVGVMAMFSKTALGDDLLDRLASISDKLALGIKEKKSEQMVHFLSFYDSLTDLPNRHFFYEAIKQTMLRCDNRQRKFALFLVDLDNFNRVNKSLGHKLGDACLKLVSERLSGVLGKIRGAGRDPSSQVIRMGGDHFIILLDDADNTARVDRVAKAILGEVSRSLELDGHEIFLTASIGVVIYPDDGADADMLFRNAEAALDHVKKKGKNDFGFYSESMNRASLEFLDFETDLRRAIDRRDLLVYYQPKVDLDTGQVTGMEALARWQRPDKSFVSPKVFIPFAETNGLIQPIGRFVLETACRQNRVWQEAGMKQIPVAVNASGKQFGHKEFVPTVFSVLDATGLDPEFLELEITETTIMVDPDRAVRNLKVLKDHGVGISLDDFGTGYSSLSYLQKLPLDTLKIDLSFIRNILTNPNDAAIVKTIIAMAHNLDLRVIAEGVEEKAQLAFLKDQGCDSIQGYLFSPPVPPAQFPGLIETELK